mmetsp:Transcript_80705/g.237159  ORF Transcript_80705/g.237159 Transcript_80705/m.237159 type:complete len:270 (+) Transcript_80705:173-982(+)
MTARERVASPWWHRAHPIQGAILTIHCCKCAEPSVARAAATVWPLPCQPRWAPCAAAECNDNYWLAKRKVLPHNNRRNQAFQVKHLLPSFDPAASIQTPNDAAATIHAIPSLFATERTGCEDLGLLREAGTYVDAAVVACHVLVCLPVGHTVRQVHRIDSPVSICEDRTPVKDDRSGIQDAHPFDFKGPPCTTIGAIKAKHHLILVPDLRGVAREQNNTLSDYNGPHVQVRLTAISSAPPGFQCLQVCSKHPSISSPYVEHVTEQGRVS